MTSVNLQGHTYEKIYKYNKNTMLAIGTFRRKTIWTKVVMELGSRDGRVYCDLSHYQKDWYLILINSGYLIHDIPNRIILIYNLDRNILFVRYWYQSKDLL